MIQRRSILSSVLTTLVLAPALARGAPWEFKPGVTLPGNPGLVTQKLELADIDNDGWVDVLVANSAGDSVGGLGTAQLNQLLLNLEGAAFAEIPAFKVKDNAFVIKTGDVDRDGRLDLVVGDNFGGLSYVLLNKFPDFVRVDIPQALTVGDLELGDIDADGDLDIVFATWGGSLPFGAPNDPGGPVVIALGDGMGAFVIDPTRTPVGPDNQVSWSLDLDLVDLDNDFDLDILVASRGPGPAQALRNVAGVYEPLPIPALQPADLKPINTAFLPFDLNVDGVFDVLTLHDGPVAGACGLFDGVNLCAQSDTVLTNDGIGQFEDNPGELWPASDNPPALDFDAVNLDFDSDGVMDALIVGFQQADGQPSSKLLRSDGAALKLFPPEVNPPLPQVPELARAFGLGLADFDRDGRVDVAVAVRDATQPNAVLFGVPDAVFGVGLDVAPPVARIETAIIDPMFGEAVSVRARVHDNRVPARWHDFQFDEQVPTYQTTSPTDVVHMRRIPYIEFALGLAQNADLLGLPDDSPQKFIASGEWAGEAVWRFNFAMPFAGKLVDTISYRVCAIDAAGNRGCDGLLASTVTVDPDDCGDGELQPWEVCDEALDPMCFQCSFSCGDGVCDAPSENGASCPQDCAVCDADAVCEDPEDPFNCPTDCTCDFDGSCEPPSENGFGCPNDCIECDFDGICDGAESNDTCPSDCGPCDFDGFCDGAETEETCPSDCFCDFDGVCEPPENGDICPNDCFFCDFDGLCEGGEDGFSCPSDCAVCDFDGFCEPGEDAFNCPEDCGEGAVCGDGLCTDFEDPNNCPVDCTCDFNGLCEGIEDVVNCPSDCGGFCGDGLCSSGENGMNCSVDCGAGSCADGVCSPGEEATCPEDCPIGPCGDGLCGFGETLATCPQDCVVGDCGDGFCDPQSEENATCPLDCRGECGNGECELNEDCPEDCETGGEDECPDGAPEVDGVCQGADSGGCSCRGADAGGDAGLLVFGLGALALRRRRRRG